MGSSGNVIITASEDAVRQGQQDMHKLQEFVRYHRQNEKSTTIAARMGWDRKTERKYRRRLSEAGLLDGPVDQLPSMAALRKALRRHAPTPPQEVSTVEAHRAFIEGKASEGLGPTAIHGLLEEQVTGFTGSLSAVKRMVARWKRDHRVTAEDVAIPVHTAPGQQAQVDFGYVGKLQDPVTGKRRKAWVFVMVLSHSRLLYAEVVFSQDVETWLALHRRAFKSFGGVPHVVVPDNLKAAVIKAAFSSSDMGEVNRTYRTFARQFGFQIDPTPAYSPEKKGKVESAVKYVKGAFFEPRADQLVDLTDTNRRLFAWIDDKANVRIHGTTGKRPVEVFDAVEQQALMKLPEGSVLPVLWCRARVARTSHVTFRGRFYSVPWQHLEKEAWLRLTGEQLSIYVDDERVADHRTQGATPWSTVPAHLPEERRDLALRDPDTWYRRAAAIDPVVESYAREVMASDEVVFPLRRVQSIVRRLEKLPTDRAVSVVEHAARFGCHRPDGIRRIIDRELDLAPPSGGYVDPTWATSGRFARQADSFLKAHGGTHASA